MVEKEVVKTADNSGQEVIDPSDYKVVEGKKKKGNEDPRPMDVREYMEEDGEELGLKPLQVESFARYHRGKILPYSEWKRLIKDDLTRRA